MLRWVALAVLLIAAAGAIVMWSPLPFVATFWNVQGEPAAFLNARHRVADRLASSGRLIGKTRDEVVAQLGMPTATDKFTDHGLVYVLGPERGYISIDYEWLIIDFDSSGKVRAAAVVAD
jgi:hypothetical protein